MDPHFAKLAEITKRNKGLWSVESEQYLLKYWGK
jgi:L-sorbose 1-phosphate reductase